MKLEQPIDYPQDWPVLDDSLMSNFDRAVDEKIAAELKTVQAVADYPGWEFNAKCWWDGKRGQFLAAVRRYGSLRATYAAEDPKDIMREVSDDFGYE